MRSHYSYFKAKCKRACCDAAARMRTPPGKVNIPFRDLIVASVHFHVFCPGYHVYARARLLRCCYRLWLR